MFDTGFVINFVAIGEKEDQFKCPKVIIIFYKNIKIFNEPTKQRKICPFVFPPISFYFLGLSFKFHRLRTCEGRQKSAMKYKNEIVGKQIFNV